MVDVNDMVHDPAFSSCIFQISRQL